MLLLPTQCLCTQNLTLSFVIIVILRPFVLRIDINHAPMIVLKITVTTVTVTLLIKIIIVFLVCFRN